MNSVISLGEQMECIEDIIVVDSSDDNQYNMLAFLLTGYEVKHIRFTLREFNKPKLLNKGIKEASSKWIMCTDADYLFAKDFLHTCTQQRNEKRMMFKEVVMLPNMDIKKGHVLSWKFPKGGYNVWGHLANGACQYATKEFFVSNPYPEEMDGFSAYDNLMAYMAFNNGLEIHWIPRGSSEILHQYHPIVNKMAGNNRAKFDRNQETLQEYIRKHNLPCILSK